MDFRDRVMWVTGGGSGIGAAIAKAFAKAGAHVIVSDIDRDAGERAVAAIAAEAGSAEAHVLDVTDSGALELVARSAIDEHGGIDHVVACAGTASRYTIAQMSPDAWRRVIDVNLTGAFLTTKAAVPAIAKRGGGTITVISSVAAEHIAFWSGIHYAASKTGLIGFARHAAFELGIQNVRVNALGPGPMSNRMGGGRVPEERVAAARRNLPLQRVVEPEDVANVCLFLASPYARAITGVYLPVDCGFLTGRGASYRGYFEAHGEEI